MRHVFPTSQVCHLWAHAHQDSARNGVRSVYFKGDTIFSYGSHFPMARRLALGVYAVTTRSYSSTTAGHQSGVQRAIPRYAEVVYVHNPAEPAHRQIEATEHQIALLLEKASRGRVHGQEYLASALGKALHFNRYAELTGDPARISTEDLAGENLAGLRQIIAKRRAAEMAAEKLKAELAAVRFAEDIESWRNHGGSAPWIQGATVVLRLGYFEGGKFGSSGQIIETSHGAQIPVDDAKRLWPVIQRIMRGDRDYEVGMPLGNYQLTRIRTDGSIVVVCHDIPFAEIERMAVALDLVELEAA